MRPTGAGAAGQSRVVETGMRVTTDSIEYCVALESRLALLPAGTQEPSRALAREGRRLCETGHVRAGIAKLRRALRAAQPHGLGPPH